MSTVTVHVASHYRSYADQCIHYLDRRHVGVPTAPVEIPSAWKGSDLARLGDLRQRLTDEQVADIERALRLAKATGRPLAEWRREDFPLPALDAAIAAWRQEIQSGKGFVLLSGIPVDRWGVENCERFFWSLGLHLGTPGAQNPEGHLLGHVRDTGRAKQDPLVRLYQTSERLGYHCDAADVVGLLCLQDALSGGHSRFVSSVAVWNELLRREPDLARRAFEPLYVDLRNEESPGSPPWNFVTPCRFDGEVLRTFWHDDYFRSVERHEQVQLTPEVRRLLDVYDEIANSPELYYEMRLAPGDIQLISNHTIIHARSSSYVDGPGHHRHLLRLWLSL